MEKIHIIVRKYLKNFKLTLGFHFRNFLALLYLQTERTPLEFENRELLNIMQIHLFPAN